MIGIRIASGLVAAGVVAAATGWEKSSGSIGVPHTKPN
jgi:hypothetical protein